MQATEERRWYLVQCKPRQEFRALEHLQQQGFECLLPMHQIERLRNGQWRCLKEPLFPGYLFIELDTLRHNWMPIRSTRGVSQVVRFGTNPLSVPPSLINRLRHHSPPTEHELKPGDKVTVGGSNGDGMEAIFLSKDGTNRVLLLLKILQREVRISVPTDRLVKTN